jgi:hypothetical protein
MSCRCAFHHVAALLQQVEGDRRAEAMRITMSANSLWCGAKFTPRRTGGSRQTFCGPKHREAFWAAARRWVVAAMTSGILSVEALREASPTACTLLQAEEEDPR